MSKRPALVTACLLMFSFDLPARAAAETFTSSWEATSSTFPDEASPPWNRIASGTPQAPQIADGILTIQTTANAENIVYRQTEPLIDFDVANPLVIEARMRFVSGSSSAASRAPATVMVTTGPATGIAFFVAGDEIFLTAGEGMKGASANVDTDDAPHDYRLEIAHDGSVKVLYDDVETLTGATYTSVNDHGSIKRILWGEGSILAFGVSEWVSFRHNALFPGTTTTLAITTTTSPATTSTVPGSICGDANIDTRITATDALAILRAAVGQALSCPPARCDTDNSGGLLASDALRVLRFAVGIPVTLDCPA
jgi:hypothetical protein